MSAKRILAMFGFDRSMPGIRRRLARKYLIGEGIEIGALDYPTPVSPKTKVRYVDRVNVAQLRTYYPELEGHKLTEPDLVEDGELLPSFASGTLDFIIANHMLEHCENPLGTIRVHLDRLRPNGRLYYAIPDKRQCFDRSRPLTRFEHLVADDADGGENSRELHYMEWAKEVNGYSEPALAEANARENMRNGYSIHFHVWTPTSFREMLQMAAQYLKEPFIIERFVENGTEAIAILRKQ